MSPERSLLIGQQLVENAKIEKLKWDILEDFQTLYIYMVIFLALDRCIYGQKVGLTLDLDNCSKFIS